MFYFFLFSLTLFGVISVIGEDKGNNMHTIKPSNYPSGYELKRQLRKTISYQYDTINLNYDLIEEHIFRDYVYHFEKISGYSREIAIRKALDKYIKVYNILDEKYKIS